MRNLKRNKETIYYALYAGAEDTIKGGYFTGGKTKIYGSVVQAEMATSPPRTAYGFVSSVVTMEFFGYDKPYSKSMWTEDMDCPINEETIVWLGMGELSEYGGSYEVGDKVIHDGKIYECISDTAAAEFDSNAWSEVRHNYIVSGIAKSLNVITYALKEVDFR